MSVEKISAWYLIRTSFRKNLLPGIFLWVFASALLICYFNIPSFKSWLEGVSDIKTEYGYLFSALATALFGGLIPFVILVFRGQYRGLSRMISCLAFYMLFWGWKGVEIDAFYRLQAWLWGADKHVLTIIKKVSFDMFVFSAIYAVPCIAVFNVWKDQRFNLKKSLFVMDREFFKTRLFAMIVSNWIVWIPSVSIVYCMPSALQVVMFNFILCFWVLMISMLSDTR